MTTLLWQVSLLTFLTALAIDSKKLIAYTRTDWRGYPFGLTTFGLTLGSRRKRPIMTAAQYENHIAIKDPYDLFDTIHSPPPVRMHQPIHVIALAGLVVLQPESTSDAQDPSYRIPLDRLSDRTVIFSDKRTLVKTTRSVIGELRRDPMCIAIIATGDTTMRIFVSNVCEDALIVKVTSLYRQVEYKQDAIRLEHATLYIVK